MTPIPAVAILAVPTELGSENMTGLSLDPAGDHFVLRSAKPDGTTATMPLSADEVLTLAEMAPTLRQQALMMVHPLQNKSTAVAVMAMDVFDFQLRPEMLETKLLLLLRLGNLGNSTVAYALSPNQANHLAQSIPPLLERMRAQPPTKQ